MTRKAVSAPAKLPQTYSRGVSRVAWRTSPTRNSASRISTRPAPMARNQTPMKAIRTDWNMPWARAEVMWERSPPAVASPLEMVTLPPENPQATSSSTAKRNQ